MWRCFLIEDTGQIERTISRYENVAGEVCPHSETGSDAHYRKVILGRYSRGDKTDYPLPDDDDPRWPEVCTCGHRFTDGVLSDDLEGRSYPR